MLNNQSIDVGVNLSEVLVEHSVQLGAKGNTLLSKLASACSNNKPSYASPMMSADDVKSMLSAAAGGIAELRQSGKQTYIPSEHDAFMDNYIQDLGRLVKDHISFTRTVVNKEVTKFQEAVESALSNHRHRQPEELFSVSYYKPGEVFTNGGILDRELNDEYQPSDASGDPEYLNLSALEAEEDLLPRLLVGEPETDAMIAAWHSGCGDARIRGFLLNAVQEWRLGLRDRLDYCMANFLFFRNATERQDLNTGESLATVLRRTAINRRYFAAKLKFELDSYRGMIRQGILLAARPYNSFSYFNTEPLELLILEDSFAQLVEAGGGIEAIFGFLSKNNGDGLTVEALTKDLNGFVTQWVHIRRLYAMKVADQRLETSRHLIAIAFDTSLAEDAMTDAEKEMFAGNAAELETTRQQGYTYIDSLDVNDLDRVDLIALELVARIRFRFSAAYILLKNMSRMMEYDEKLAPEDAGLYASIDYMLDYLMDQAIVPQSTAVKAR